MAIAEHLAEIELSKLYAETGIDLASCPPVMTAAVLGPVIGFSEGALAQNRYLANLGPRSDTIPYIKIGHRIRYLRADVARFLLANRARSKQVVDRESRPGPGRPRGGFPVPAPTPRKLGTDAYTTRKFGRPLHPIPR
jgi:hypothetical protein